MSSNSKTPLMEGYGALSSDDYGSSGSTYAGDGVLAAVSSEVKTAVDDSTGESTGGLDIAPGQRKEGSVITPSAPPGNDFKRVRQDRIQYLNADYASFDEFIVEGEQPWLKGEDSKQHFSQLVMNEQWFQRNQHWVRRPNADNIADLMTRINHRPNSYRGKAVRLLGKLIQQGQIRFVLNNGRQEVAGPGRHFLGWNVNWDGDAVHLNEPYISHKNIKIVVIPQGQIGMAVDNNKPIVLLPGRHAYNSVRFIFKAEDMFSLNRAVIIKGNITIVTIKPGQIGFAYDNGQPVLLKPGVHASASAAFKYVAAINAQTLRTEQLASDLSLINAREEAKGVNVQGQPQQQRRSRSSVVHGAICIVRVGQNEVGCAYYLGKPVMLRPGLHIKNSQSFRFSRVANVRDPHIEFDTMHLIRVLPNQIGLAWEGSNPIFLKPGQWFRNSSQFRFAEFKLVNEQKIKHGSITRYIVQENEVGFGIRKGRIEVLVPGVKVERDPNFTFQRTFSLDEEVIRFGNVSYITTYRGNFRPIWIDGKLQILTEGLAKFNNPNIKIGNMVSLQQTVFPLKRIEVLTQDRTPMLVTGQVTYHITSPENLVNNLGVDKLQRSIEQTTDATLRYAFSKVGLSTISPDSHGLQEKKGKGVQLFSKGDLTGGEGASFRGQLCHYVQTRMQEHAKSWGIVINEVAIADIHFKDKKVAETLANATAQTRTAEAQFDLTQAQNKTQIAAAKALAQRKLIEMENLSTTTRMQAKVSGEVEVIKNKAETEARSLQQRQMYESKSAEIVSLAQAKLQADKLEAEGRTALAKVEIHRLENPAVLKLEMMRLWVQGMQSLARAPVPAVNIQSGTDTNAQAQMLNMFRGQGTHLLRAAMGGGASLFSASPQNAEVPVKPDVPEAKS